MRECVTKNQIPSTAHYFEWQSQFKDKTYSFVMEMIFTYALAIFIYRIGVRRNNSEFIQCGRIKFSPLFCLMHSPKYTDIQLKQSMIRSKCPPQILDFLGNNESFLNSSHPSRHEGADYCLENVNKDASGPRRTHLPEPMLDPHPNLVRWEKPVGLINTRG